MGWGSPEFRSGMEAGRDLGAYDTYEVVKAAYEAGEIELWLAWQKPKTMEEWDVWDEEHGDLSERWKKNP